VEHIIAAAYNLDRLIEDLLQYSRLDAETPSPTEIELAAIIQEILTDWRGDILEQDVDVTITLAVSKLRAWERGLVQVLANLIDNAVKYSRGAEVRQVQITSTALETGIRIAIRDNGIGFDMKYHDRIFGLFNRLVRLEDFEGTGAGLAIVKKIADKSGWKVWAESEPGAGATFWLELPGDSGAGGSVAG
jgi:signal transduction histidine kinase